MNDDYVNTGNQSHFYCDKCGRGTNVIIHIHNKKWCVDCYGER